LLLKAAAKQQGTALQSKFFVATKAQKVEEKASVIAIRNTE
jgi:hypothetical protein